MEIVDYPKTECPFERVKVSHEKYLITPELREGFEWIYDIGVRAVDKLHGTNVGFFFKDGKVSHVSNRKNLVSKNLSIHSDMSSLEVMAISGYLNAMQRGWISKEYDGYVYGELVGEKINGNLHGVKEYLWVPFDILKQKFHWKSWISNKYPKDFDSISTWFRDLPSLFGEKYGDGKNYAEGLVFWHPDGRRAKIRRDMFEWYYN